MKKLKWIVFIIIVVALLIWWANFFIIENLKPRLNLILISIDTLNADHLGCYGYHRNTSPNIDKFAKKSILFKNAYTSFNVTFPSHTAMFTGIHPIIAKAQDGGSANLGFIPKQLKTIGEIMKINNYKTGAFTDGMLVSGGLGFNRGFDIYEDFIRTGSKLNIEKAIRFISSLNNDENYFVFVHTYDVHSPYKPAGTNIDYNPKFVSKRYSGKLKSLIGNDSIGEYIINMECGRERMSIADSKFLISNYDSCIRFVDAQIGKLIDFLEKTGRLKNTVVIITADHGEQFYPTKTKGFKINIKNFLWHNGITYNMSKVPLIVYIPGRDGRVVKSPVINGINILPTIIDVLHLKGAPHYKLSGKSLLRYMKTGRKDNYVFYINPFIGISFFNSEKQYIIPNKDSLERIFYNIQKEKFLKRNIPDKIIVADLKKNYKEYKFVKIDNNIKTIFKQKLDEVQKHIEELKIKSVGFKLREDAEGNLKIYLPASYYLWQNANSVVWSEPIYLKKDFTLKFKYGIWNEYRFKNPSDTYFDIYIKEVSSNERVKIGTFQLSVAFAKKEKIFDYYLNCYMIISKDYSKIDVSKYIGKKVEIGLGIRSECKEDLWFIWKDLELTKSQISSRTLEYQKKKLKALGYFQ